MKLTQKQIALGWNISAAHEWMQALPLKDATLECVACGLKSKIIDMSKAKRCHEHVVGKNSGW